MNILQRLIIFFDPEARNLHIENRALARSLKVNMNFNNHPIVESKRLHSLDFNRVHQQFSPRFEPPAPRRTPVSFDIRAYRIYPDNYLN